MDEFRIDLNADLGESPEAVATGADFELMRYITSANIACGGHAGDEVTMKQTLAAARELKVAPGAHPSYPDRANFGRVVMTISTEELEVTVREQVMRLMELVAGFGIKLAHVKPHGALYHAARDVEVAQAIGRAILSIDPQLVMVGQAGSSAIKYWRAMGLHCAGEAFADRAYEEDGSLRSRSLVGALIDTPARAAAQAMEIVAHNRVLTYQGTELHVDAETLCIHSDTPNATVLAREVKRQLTEAGFQVRRL